MTDSMPALALGVEPAEKDIMNRSPRDSRGSIFTRRNIFDIVLIGLMEALLALIAYGIGYLYFKDGVIGTTMAFVTLGAGLFSLLLSVSSESVTLFAPWTIGHTPLPEPCWRNLRTRLLAMSFTERS